MTPLRIPRAAGEDFVYDEFQQWRREIWGFLHNFRIKAALVETSSTPKRDATELAVWWTAGMKCFSFDERANSLCHDPTYKILWESLLQIRELAILLVRSRIEEAISPRCDDLTAASLIKGARHYSIGLLHDLDVFYYGLESLITQIQRAKQRAQNSSAMKGNQSSNQVHGGSILSFGDVSVEGGSNIVLQIHGSADRPTFGKLIEDFTREANAVGERLPDAETKERFFTQCADFVESAQQCRKDRKWYEIRPEGLLEAARTLGKLGAPIIELVDKIIASLKAAVS